MKKKIFFCSLTLIILVPVVLFVYNSKIWHDISNVRAQGSDCTVAGVGLIVNNYVDILGGGNIPGHDGYAFKVDGNKKARFTGDVWIEAGGGGAADLTVKGALNVNTLKAENTAKLFSISDTYLISEGDASGYACDCDGNDIRCTDQCFRYCADHAYGFGLITRCIGGSSKDDYYCTCFK